MSPFLGTLGDNATYGPSRGRRARSRVARARSMTINTCYIRPPASQAHKHNNELVVSMVLLHALFLSLSIRRRSHHCHPREM